MTRASDLCRHKTSGFTLVELMVVMVIVGLLAAISLPSYRIHILKGHLETAKSYLMAITAKERIYYNRYGDYYASPSHDEQDLEDILGVDLQDAADYCFVVRTGDNNYISSSGNSGGGDGGDAAFEVWAILRHDGGANDAVTVSDGAGVTCLTADEKHQAAGWVSDAVGEIGSEGRVVVMRYPVPHFDQVLDTASRIGRSDIYLDWEEGGITLSDPLK